MCRYCVEYGDGTKWYLNPKNYTEKLHKGAPHWAGVVALGGVGKNTFELNIAAGADPAVPDVNYPDLVNMVLENVLNHAGQVVPLEDALKVVDLAKAPWVKMHCACRKYFGQEDINVCIYPSPVSDNAAKERPWEKDQELISKEQAKEHLKKTHDMGYIHSLWHGGVDTDGIPVWAICTCGYPDCMGVRARDVYGAMNGMRKGEYIAKIDKQKCQNGCGNTERKCMSYCHFGALRYSPSHKAVFVDTPQCFGCGMCRDFCPFGAVEFRDRSVYPALVDNW